VALSGSFPLAVAAAGGGKARDSAPQRRQRREFLQSLALKWFASTAKTRLCAVPAPCCAAICAVTLLRRAGRVSYPDRSDQTTLRFRSSIEAEGAKAVSTVRTVIHDRRIEVPALADLADGTEVILTIGTVVVDDGGPMSPAEITRVLAAMERMQPLEIPDEVGGNGPGRLGEDAKSARHRTHRKGHQGRVPMKRSKIGRPIGQNDIMIAAIA
jgi:hypothetical protein